MLSYARRYRVPFLCLWYNSTWYGTPVSRTIGDHSTNYATGSVHKQDLALNNPYRLICQKTESNETKSNQTEHGPPIPFFVSITIKSATITNLINVNIYKALRSIAQEKHGGENMGKKDWRITVFLSHFFVRLTLCCTKIGLVIARDILHERTPQYIFAYVYI